MYNTGMRTLVLGLGNPILGDDAIGLRVAEAVRSSLPHDTAIEVDTDCWGGLRLMERLVGYELAVIVDATCTGDHPPGTILRLGPDDMPTQRTASAHDVTLPTALRLAAEMGLPMPREIVIWGIEAQNVLDFAEELSPAVAAAIPAAVRAVLDTVVSADGQSIGHT